MSENEKMYIIPADFPSTQEEIHNYVDTTNAEFYEENRKILSEMRKNELENCKKEYENSIKQLLELEIQLEIISYLKNKLNEIYPKYIDLKKKILIIMNNKNAIYNRNTELQSLQKELEKVKMERIIIAEKLATIFDK